MNKLYTAIAAAGILATAFTLSACSSNASPTATSSSMSGMHMGSSSAMPTSAAADFNDADVTFATDMVMHHQQAIEMAQMVLDKTGVDTRVTALAKKIKAAQAPEITTMDMWLGSWGQPRPAATGMSMGSMTGLMTQADMDKLKAASASDANSLFLTQMTEHHTGAIAMAQTEVTSGSNPDAIALAKKIVTDQTAEIADMKSLLASL